MPPRPQPAHDHGLSEAPARADGRRSGARGARSHAGATAHGRRPAGAGARSGSGARRAPAAPAATPPPPAEFAASDNLRDVFYAFDKAEIRPGDAKTLDAGAAYLKTNPRLLVLVEGHCDERGTEEYNIALGGRAPPPPSTTGGPGDRGGSVHPHLLRESGRCAPSTGNRAG